MFNKNSAVTSDETPLEANTQIESDAQTQNDMFSIDSTVTSDKADQFGNITNDFEIPASSFETQYKTRPPASSLGFP